MPAASYREGPDGHSSRKQNSKRRRAKCSPSFVSGRVIGHGDIPPRCVPECSAMALHRAVPRCSPQPRQHSVFRASGGDVLQVLPSAPFFCGEGGSYLVRGESRRSSMARFHHGAFPGGNPWQVLRSMHPKSGLRRENRQFAARFARHASEMSWFWQDMRAMHPKSPANRLSGTHGAKILPGRTPFRCTDPSNHARRANVAIRRSAKPPERPRPRRRRTVRAARARSPGPRNTAQEAAPSSPPGQQVSPAAPAAPPPLFANTSQ